MVTLVAIKKLPSVQFRSLENENETWFISRNYFHWILYLMNRFTDLIICGSAKVNTIAHAHPVSIPFERWTLDILVVTNGVTFILSSGRNKVYVFVDD